MIHPRQPTVPTVALIDPVWETRRKGQRYPYPAGRACERCGHELSRYNPGAECFHHQPADQDDSDQEVAA